MTPLLATTCQFLDVDVSLFRGKFNMRVYDKSDNIYFPIVNFPFLDGDVPLAPSDIMWCLPLSHVISFCTYMFKFCICNNVSDFIYRDLVITDTLLHKRYRFHKLRVTKLYYRYKDLVYYMHLSIKTVFSIHAFI